MSTQPPATRSACSPPLRSLTSCWACSWREKPISRCGRRASLTKWNREPITLRRADRRSQVPVTAAAKETAFAWSGALDRDGLRMYMRDNTIIDLTTAARQCDRSRSRPSACDTRAGCPTVEGCSSSRWPGTLSSCRQRICTLAVGSSIRRQRLPSRRRDARVRVRPRRSACRLARRSPVARVGNWSGLEIVGPGRLLDRVAYDTDGFFNDTYRPTLMTIESPPEDRRHRHDSGDVCSR